MTNLDTAIARIIKERTLAVDSLTETQLSEAFRQALLSGDFVRFVSVEGNSQRVCYIPFREVEYLRGRIKQLEEERDEEKNCV